MWLSAADVAAFIRVVPVRLDFGVDLAMVLRLGCGQTRGVDGAG